MPRRIALRSYRFSTHFAFYELTWGLDTTIFKMLLCRFQHELKSENQCLCEVLTFCLRPNDGFLDGDL